MPPPVTNTSLVQYRLHASTTYNPAYCAEILTYFTNAVSSVMQKFEESFEEEQGPKGPTKKVKGSIRAVCADMPTFERFANSIGTTSVTMRDWAVKHPDFGYAYERCKEVQKDFLIQGMLNGRINPQAGAFIAKNITDMRDDSSLVVTAAPSVDKPALADRTPAELQALREALQKATALGFQLMIKGAEEPEGAAAEFAEGMGDVA